MNADAQYELAMIKSELQSIIDELCSISSGIERDFEGIGNTQCSHSIYKLACEYEVVKQKLNSMNLSAVTEEFAEKQRKEEERKVQEAEQALKRAEAERQAELEAMRREEERKAAEKAQAEAMAQPKAKANSSKSKTSKKKTSFWGWF